MSSPATTLPTEVTALVHHVELNRAGWWEKAIHRLVLAAVWLSDHAPTVDEVRQIIQNEFRLRLAMQKLTAAFGVLEKQGMLVKLSDDSYRIPDKQRAAFESEITAAEKAASDASAVFFELVSQLCPDLDSKVVWTAFEAQFLAPLIRDVGANAYRLIAGERMVVSKDLVDRFLKPFESKHHSKLSELVSTFLDPKREHVRAHISRMLHARFCVEASGLPDTVIEKLNAAVGKQIRFRVFVDTNFLFSLLELHENPSNAAARELQEIITRLNENPAIQLVVTPTTIDEAKSSISAARFQLSGFPIGRNFTEAALHLGFSGMVERFLAARLERGGQLTAEDWFGPYLNDFVPIARAKGVELFNEKLDSYSVRQDVVDDINLVLKFEERLNANRRKSYEKVAHDMILWHFVNDKRAAYIESPIDAQDWILTVDFRLIAFDEHKRKKSRSKVPLCLHPTSLIQLLQFWVPRTKEFEEAVLSSLRLPFLFQEFDAEAERTSLRILKGLGRFEGGQDLPEQTITRVVLNDGLRGRLLAEQGEQTQLELIRDTLVSEMKAYADAESHNATQLRTAISEFDTEKRLKEEEIQDLKTKVAEEATRSQIAAEKVAAQRLEIDALKVQLQSVAETELRRAQAEAERKELREQRHAFCCYLGLLALVVLSAGVAAWSGERIFSWYAQILGPVPTKALMFMIVFVVLHLILEWSVQGRPRIARLWPFRRVKKARKFLWSFVVLSFGAGVLGNLLANSIQKQMDNDSVSSASLISRESSGTVNVNPFVAELQKGRSFKFGWADVKDVDLIREQGLSEQVVITLLNVRCEIQKRLYHAGCETYVSNILHHSTDGNLFGLITGYGANTARRNDGGDGEIFVNMQRADSITDGNVLGQGEVREHQSSNEKNNELWNAKLLTDAPLDGENLTNGNLVHLTLILTSGNPPPNSVRLHFTVALDDKLFWRATTNDTVALNYKGARRGMSRLFASARELNLMHLGTNADQVHVATLTWSE